MEPTAPKPATPETSATTPPAPAAPPPPVLTYAPDVVALIEKVRKEEHAKVYGDLERLKNDNAALQNKIKEAELALRELQATPKKDNDQKQKEREDAIKTLEATVKGQLEKIVEESNAKVNKLESALRERDLLLYKERKIAEVRASGADLIPEIISGTTEIEIDQSIITSKTRYAEIVAKVAPKPGTQTTATTPVTPPSPQTPPASPTPAGGGGDTSVQAAGLSVDQISAMTPAQYAAKRDDIWSSIKRNFDGAYASLGLKRR